MYQAYINTGIPAYQHAVKKNLKISIYRYLLLKFLFSGICLSQTKKTHTTQQKEPDQAITSLL